MSTSRFDRLDRADVFFYQVARWIGNRAATVGLDAWKNGPEHRQSRERAAGLLNRGARRIEREAVALERDGVPEGVIRTRLRDRNEDRAARSRASR
jgi:hypothetical protein